jgi:hypothetical protein
MSQFVSKAVEYDGQTSTVLVGNVTLESSVGTKDLTNSNGNAYRLATVSFNTPSGAKTELLAQVWAGTLARAEENDVKFERGQKYLAQLRKAVDPDTNEPRLFATMSHLRGADVNAEAVNEMLDMFAEVEAEVAITA